MVQSKHNPGNVRVKRDYIKYLKTTEKLKQSTIDNKLTSIRKYEIFLSYKDFAEYSSETGANFYSELQKTVKNGKITVKTVIKDLENVKTFLAWYFLNHKVKNRKYLLSCLIALEPSKQDTRLSKINQPVEYPTIIEFEKIIDFEEKTITDKRDKAILIFLLISCARIEAIRQAKVGTIDTEKMLFIQDPLLALEEGENIGIETKWDRYIYTKLLPLEQKYYDIFRNWLKFLANDCNFTALDPLFPRIIIDRRNNAEDITHESLRSEKEYNTIIEKRCNAVGITPYSPHKFRHLGIRQALKHVRTGEQLKALSQNVGHGDIAVILDHYAEISHHERCEIIDRMIRLSPCHKTADELSNDELLSIVQQRLEVEKNF